MSGGRSAFNIQGIAAGVEAWGDRIKDRAEDAMRDVVADAEDGYRDVIRNSHTPTGDARAAAGTGEAGRIDDSDMLNAVDSEVHREGRDTIVGRWGFTEELEEYFLRQEYGIGKMSAMNGLATTLDKAVDEYGARLDRITGGH